MKKQGITILTIILVILGAVFVVLNTGDAEINFGFGKVRLPLIIVLLIVFFFGAFLMFLLSSLATVQKGTAHKKENKANQSKIDDLSHQISQLQNELNKTISTQDEDAKKSDK